MATRHWFENIVIGEKLCPFAPPLLQQPNLLRIVSSNATNEQEVVADVANEVQDLMNESESHETTLVVFGSHPCVHTFRDFVRLSWTLQEQVIGETYLDQLQLVLFHPRATHQTYGEEDDENPADYTIRSPYPTIHLLREVDVLKAVQGGYPNLESLPTRNKTKLVEQGLEVCQKRLEKCYKSPTGG